MAEQCFKGGGGRRSQVWARRLRAAALRRRVASAPGLGCSRRTLTVLALTVLASGCYSYTEVSPAAVPPGSNVRLRVAPRVPLSVGETPLPDGGRMLRGKLLQGSSADTLLCSVALSNGDPATPLRGLRGTVAVPVTDVQRLEVRRLQKGLTAAAVTTGALLGFAVLEWAFNITNPNEEGGDDPGGVNNARVELFRLRW